MRSRNYDHLVHVYSKSADLQLGQINKFANLSLDLADLWKQSTTPTAAGSTICALQWMSGGRLCADVACGTLATTAEVDQL